MTQFVINPFTGRFDETGSSGGGSGNVTGPASSVNGDIAIFSGTTGKIIADSGIAFPIPTTEGGTGLNSYTTGDILYASASNDLSKLSLATIPGQFLNYNGTNVNWFNPRNQTMLFDDFINGNNASSLNWRNGTSGTGAAITQVATDNAHPGVNSLATGTTATGVAWYDLGPNSANGPIKVGGGALTILYVFQVPVLSNGTDTFAVRLGLSGTQSGGTYDNGIYFEYNDGGSQPNIQLFTSSATTKTQIDSGVALSAATWATVRFVVNAAGTSVAYFINEVAVGTITTNIPSTNIAPQFEIIKSNGTTSRLMYIDLFYMYQNLTSLR